MRDLHVMSEGLRINREFVLSIFGLSGRYTPVLRFRRARRVTCVTNATRRACFSTIDTTRRCSSPAGRCNKTPPPPSTQDAWCSASRDVTSWWQVFNTYLNVPKYPKRIPQSTDRLGALYPLYCDFNDPKKTAMGSQPLNSKNLRPGFLFPSELNCGTPPPTSSLCAAKSCSISSRKSLF